MNEKKVAELEEKLEIKWSLDWIENINISELKIYPIQFANVIRLEQNDVVYIFDEVGTGKTISSGLMAWHYLNSHPEKEVLVITTPAMSGINGQFVGDWKKKLGFQNEELSKRVSCINNVGCNIANIHNPERFGMVIIDEAHLFLNRETERFKELCRSKLQPEKLVFLTATPIKNDWDNDIESYIQIAKSLVKSYTDDMGKKAFDELKGIDKNNITICERFDPKLSVTRYFKDVLEYIKFKDANCREGKIDGVKRKDPVIWEYDPTQPDVPDIKGNYTCKQRRLLQGIREELKDDSRCKFVVFTNFVKGQDGAYKLGEMFEEQDDFVNWDSEESRNDSSHYTYYIVTGENKQELKWFDPKNLEKREGATVLIVNRQIAEQGVNLHSCNWVINYHISSWPATLEQRFGRVDRMGSEYEDVTMCYLIGDLYDSSTVNFFYAVNCFKSQIIKNLPSRNVILDVEMIEKAKKALPLFMERINRLKEIVSNQNIMDKVKEALKSDVPIDKVDDNLKEMYEFCWARKDDIRYEDKYFIRDVEEKLKEEEKICSKSYDREYDEKIANIANQIFYITEENEIKKIESEECADSILNSPCYNDCKELIGNLMKIPYIISNKKILTYLDEKILNAFKQNNIDDIFPLDGYKRLFTRFFPLSEMGDHLAERAIILEHAEQIMSYSKYYREILGFINSWRNTKRNEGASRVKPFCEYSYNDYMYFYENKSDGSYEASIFMKLFYYCFRYPKCKRIPAAQSQSEFEEWEKNCSELLEVMGYLSDDITEAQKEKYYERKKELKDKLKSWKSSNWLNLELYGIYTQFRDIFFKRRSSRFRDNIEDYIKETGRVLRISGEKIVHPDSITLKINHVFRCPLGGPNEKIPNEEEYKKQMIEKYHLDSDPEIYDILRPYFLF